MDTQSTTAGMIANGAVQMMPPELLLQQIRSGVAVLVIDVRERTEVIETGAIANARSFPLSQLRSRITELHGQHRECVVVVSQNDRRSRAAAVTLAMAGFGEVTALEGGMTRWLALDYPVEVRGPESVRCIPMSLR